MDRLYYDNPTLLEFDATVTRVEDRGEKALVSLDRSAFYPTSGGQNFDTGLIYALATGAACGSSTFRSRRTRVTFCI